MQFYFQAVAGDFCDFPLQPAFCGSCTGFRGQQVSRWQVGRWDVGRWEVGR